MAAQTGKLQESLSGLRRKHAARVAIAYVVVAWLVLQVASVVVQPLGLPSWTMAMFIVLGGIGFPIALLLAWAYQPAAAPGPSLAIEAAPVPAPLEVRNGPSVAVLPFTDLSPTKDQDYFCDGVADEVTTALGGISGLRLAARSSAFRFKSPGRDVREVARALGVATLLEGSVRKSGDRVRISAQLASAEGYELWAATFDRSLQDVFAIQEEIAQAVVKALRVQLSAREEGRLQRGPGTRNMHAYEMYLRGRQFLLFRAEGQVVIARQMFRGAIELDPHFAAAQAGLADACFFMLQWGFQAGTAGAISDDDLRTEALAASSAALELDPGLAEAHVAQGNLLSLAGNPPAAEAAFRRALALNPALAFSYYWFARHLFAEGRFAESAEMFEEAARRDPEDYASLALVVGVYRSLGDRDKERSSVQRALGRIERRLSLEPEDVRAFYLGGGLDIVSGNRERGLARLARAVQLRPDDFATQFNVACGYANAGLVDEAIALLDRATQGGRGLRKWIEKDSDLAPLHGDPRFQALLARMR
ncbi:MAG TPA: tetratricopeptide repeat protein [Myxococcales bacterium]|jgi:TolB-like protein/tetratricopeptide (TPR) repeat protein